jgi:3-oxoacyl-[acyl-carrier protein] reductase
MGRLDGKVAIVTGAGGGIGREHARLLAAEGALVVVNDIGLRTGADAAAVVAEITDAGGTAVASTASATFDGADEIVQTALDSFGGVDILVNNATAGAMNDLWEFTEKQWNFTVGVNVSGYFAMIRTAAPHMCRKGSGAIVNTSSGSGFGHPAMIAYSTAKEGVIGLTRTTAKEIGRFGVRCNAIRPFATGVSTAQYAKDAGSWMKVMTLTMGPEPGVESHPDSGPEDRTAGGVALHRCRGQHQRAHLPRRWRRGVAPLGTGPRTHRDPTRWMGPRRPRRERTRSRPDQPLHPGFVPRAEALQWVTTPTRPRRGDPSPSFRCSMRATAAFRRQW